MKLVCFENDIRYAKKKIQKIQKLSVPNDEVIKNFDKFIKRKREKITPSFLYYGKIFTSHSLYKKKLEQLLKLVANICKKDINKYKGYVHNISN